MKRLLSIICILGMFLIPNILVANCGNGNCNVVTSPIYNANANFNQNTITTRLINTNLNLNTQKQNQNQGQLQGQVQGQSMINGQEISPVQELKVDVPRPVIDTPQIVPFDIPIYQNGQFGDYTTYLPKIKGLTKFDPNKETIVEVLAVYDGWKLSRIRLQDLLTKLIETKEEGANIRYFVQYRGDVSSGGVGGGAAAARAATDGLTSEAGSIMPGYHISGPDPRFTITYVLVE